MLKIAVIIALSMFRTDTANVVSTYETVTFDTNGTQAIEDDMVISVKECE